MSFRKRTHLPPIKSATPDLKRRLLQLYYLRELTRVYPDNTNYHEDLLSVEELLKKKDPGNSKASCDALLLCDELKWDSIYNPNGFDSDRFIVITPKGKTSFLNNKYRLERRRLRMEFIKDNLTIILGLIAILSAIGSAITYKTGTNSIQRELTELKKEVQLLKTRLNQPNRQTAR
jgi:hypothetical protein